MRLDDFGGTVEALAVDEAAGTVFLGGAFTTAGPVETSGIATLAGDAIGSLGPFTRFGDPRSATVRALAFSAGRLYAAGDFTAAGSAAVEHWAVHDGAGWSRPAEVSNAVSALAAHGVVGGSFLFSGPRRAPHEALAQSAADGLWVGGTFNTAGATASCGVALWRGTAGRTP